MSSGDDAAKPAKLAALSPPSAVEPMSQCELDDSFRMDCLRIPPPTMSCGDDAAKPANDAAKPAKLAALSPPSASELHPVIAVDLDDVLSQTNSMIAKCESYNNKFGHNIRHSWNLTGLFSRA
jgi:hypothetical protein